MVRDGAPVNTMHSSPTDLAEPGFVQGSAAEDNQAPDAYDVRPRTWIKRVLPRTMFGRSLLMIILPLVLVQIVATWVFYARHWETISKRLSADVAGDIGMVIDATKLARSPAETSQVLENASALSDIAFSLRRGESLPPSHAGAASVEDQLRQTLMERIGRPFHIEAAADPSDIAVNVQLPDGVLTANVPRKRLYSYTTYLFVLWMLGSSLVMMLVAGLFLRNQVKSLRRLAAAAEGFGKGRPVPFSKIEGALEVRQAAAAFIQMRDRIQRQIRQRTEMLAGVSHDLRTPLTRMKLELELLGDDPAVAELKSDVTEMQRLIDLYLDFARGEGTETPVETDIAVLLDEIAAATRRDGMQVSLQPGNAPFVLVRPNALRRCISNLVANARRYGRRVWLSSTLSEDGVDILVDDDGPGIPPSQRERVFQPFVRLDASRNPSTGGIGLGLTIARDVARSHGGDVRLETSPHGGLRARLHLPR
jgi:two-component system osmolarity sensor histidine kinase EnvZ